MKSFVLCLFALFVAAAALAGSALGRGGDWQPVVAAPFDWQCGTTTVHLSFPVNNEYQQVSTLPSGILLYKITGSLKAVLTTDAGASVTLNLSGPSNDETFNPATGAFDFTATGRNFAYLTAAQSAATGLPEIFSTKGPIDILAPGDGTIQINQLDRNTVTDICAELTQ
jgi:hypothetical protein